jgi:aminoglycoside phosphotransferase (APT) family kinase protein
VADVHTGDRDVPTEVPAGIDAERVTTWFRQNVPQLAAPLTFETISGGHSNLTYRVDDAAGRRWVLRRPPLGHVLATAHDMSREYRVISALAPTDVPVPPVVGLCDDTTVNGAPFYVMEYVEGDVLRSRADAQHLDRGVLRRCSEELADVLARIHAVDPDAVGLGDLGRKEAYVERQLRRWYRQWEQSKTRELPAVDEVHDALAANVPAQVRATLVHGDYRLDNCLIGPDGSVQAVLDWELCTLGDPLADVGLLIVYWTEADDEHAPLGDAATQLDGFLSRAEVLERYSDAADEALVAALDNINYYVAFGYWKLACILEGVYARYQAGVMGSPAGEDAASGTDLFARQVDYLAETARATLDAWTPR